jgi:hypothetical protein
MNRTWSSGLVLCLLVAGGVAAVAVAPQDATLTPGQPTQARVWIQNRGDEEAVPVSIESTAQPLRVQLAATPTVVLAPDAVVRARSVRQPWEYREVRVPSGQNAMTILNAAGAEGWETTGIGSTEQAGLVIVMKRPLP